MSETEVLIKKEINRENEKKEKPPEYKKTEEILFIGDMHLFNIEKIILNKTVEITEENHARAIDIIFTTEENTKKAFRIVCFGKKEKLETIEFKRW